MRSPSSSDSWSPATAPASSASCLVFKEGLLELGLVIHPQVNDKADKFELIGEVAEVLNDGAVEAVDSQALAVSEVAVAAADCWWAAIAVTTLLIRGATLPLLINQLKASTKMTVLMRPRLEEIREQMASKTMPCLQIWRDTLYSTERALYSGAHLCQLLHSHLTTPDSLYSFPVLTALTFFITVEASCNMQEGMEGNSSAATMKNVSRVLALLTVPFTMSFPKCHLCVLYADGIFTSIYSTGDILLLDYIKFVSLSYDLVLKAAGVKKALGIPEIPNQPAATAQRPPIGLYSALKQTLQQARKAAEGSASVSTAPTKVSNRSISSSSTISQRIRQLEKQVKGRKKKKR
ncbi:hypothetical protein F3Y22_tig00110616pilonHSYRG00012 [Hibiscus syriacus]|uniref:Uncharacterized protein n=1 Tax=Hibiscus syriacus TaxID=106335 RepID=A0A6A3A355_HIBSY|nr:hypothetical protein F3Y22_tig00110616pilonHSYRG00012 [Hibiscus syriacus]